MTITQLRYFLVICKYGKISVASEQLHVSGPTLSVSIKQLEAELELSLFVRSKNQMLLTPDGERLREKSADLVERFDRLKEDMRQTTREQLLIQIGAPSTLAEHLFRRVILDFTSRYKTALFEIPSLSSKEAAEQVADGRLELAICDQLAVNSKQLDFFPLVDCTLEGYVRNDHPLAGARDVTAEMLRDEELLLINRRAIFFDKLMQWFKESEVKPELAALFIYSHKEIMDVTVSMVERNNGVVFLMAPLFTDNLPDTITNFTLSPPLIFKTGIVRRRGAQLSRGAKLFWDFCRKYQFE
ncbi:MAG: LysR family transcriptional regulator [Oscillospiraceae bacterium]|nr:LysR family transcriptional regulator [Oscillospiraceae bacterium]